MSSSAKSEESSTVKEETSTRTEEESKINVYILETEGKSQIEHLRRVFNHPYFNLYVVKVDLPTGQKDPEWHTYKWCLEDSRDKDPNSPLIVIKESSEIKIDRSSMIKSLKEAQKKKAHVIYLHNYQDKCDLFTDKTSLEDCSTSLVRTRFPHGCQALMFTSEGCQAILGDKKMKNGHHFKVNGSFSDTLNDYIYQGHLDAYSFYPNIVNIHPDYVKNQDFLVACLPDQVAGATADPVSTTTNTWGWFWVFVVLFIILIICFAGYKYY